MRRVSGFTLIELLVVIAIIAILAAIIFPAYARAKDSAFRSGDMSRMNQIRTALQLYYVDQGAYPPQILGYVTLYASGPNMGQVIPADQLQSYLYPKRIGAFSTLQPAYDRATMLDTTTAVYPSEDPSAAGTNPVGDLNGDGVTDGADDTVGSRQAFGPGNGNVCLGGGVGCLAAQEAQFYKASGYDIAEVRVPGGGTRNELHYTLFWTQWGLTTGNSADDPRQLGYAGPPDDTIVTWNALFRNYDGTGAPLQQNRDIVLFLGGSAKPADSKGLFDKSWRYQLNP